MEKKKKKELLETICKLKFQYYPQPDQKKR